MLLFHMEIQCFFVCAALKVRRVSRRCPGRSRMCCYHAVVVLTVHHGGPSLCSRCVTVFLSSRHCAHSASRCSYKVTHPIGTGWLTQAQAIQAVIVLTVLHGALAISPAPSARGGSRKFRQTRGRIDSPKQAVVRISELCKSQGCWTESINKRWQAKRCSSQASLGPRSSCMRSFDEASGYCPHPQNALPVLTSDRV